MLECIMYSDIFIVLLSFAWLILELELHYNFYIKHDHLTDNNLDLLLQMRELIHNPKKSK